MATVKGDVHDIGKNIVGVVLQCNNFEVVDLGVMVAVREDPRDRARRRTPTSSGLSGLITPSLEEMAHVAKEMERLGFDGAAADRRRDHLAHAHRGEDRAALLRAHGVGARRLARRGRGHQLSERGAARRRTWSEVRADYVKVREAAREQDRAEERHARGGARQRGEDRLGGVRAAAARAQLGLMALRNYPLDELVPYIDWAPVLPDLGPRRASTPTSSRTRSWARRRATCMREGQAMLERIVKGRWLTASGVFGLLPANSRGRRHRDLRRRDARAGARDLAQPAPAEREARAAIPNQCLADFVAPKESGVADYIGAFAVTAGIGIDAKVREFEAKHDDYGAIMLKALADRLAEAFAEHLHQRVRTEFWGYAAGRDAFAATSSSRRSTPASVPRRATRRAPTTPRRATLFDLLDARTQRRHRRSPNPSRCCRPPR